MIIKATLSYLSYLDQFWKSPVVAVKSQIWEIPDLLCVMALSAMELQLGVFGSFVDNTCGDKR